MGRRGKAKVSEASEARLIEKPENPMKGCYVCGQEKATIEHVPARGFFPKGHHADGTAYLESIIKLPSCTRHNDDRHLDDEFIQFVIASSCFVNEIGKTVATKAKRKFSRSPGLERALFPNKKPIPKGAVFPNGLPVPDDAGFFTTEPDRMRIVRAIMKIVAGLYFKVTGYRLPEDQWADALVLPLSVLNPKGPLAGLLIEDLIAGMLWKDGVSGHPSVFRFKWAVNPFDPRQYYFLLTFYDGYRVYVAADPKKVSPIAIVPRRPGR